MGECAREGPSLLHMLLRTELLGLDPFTSRQHQASQQSQVPIIIYREDCMSMSSSSYFFATHTIPANHTGI